MGRYNLDLPNLAAVQNFSAFNIPVKFPESSKLCGISVWVTLLRECKTWLHKQYFEMGCVLCPKTGLWNNISSRIEHHKNICPHELAFYFYFLTFGRLCTENKKCALIFVVCSMPITILGNWDIALKKTEKNLCFQRK